MEFMAGVSTSRFLTELGVERFSAFDGTRLAYPTWFVAHIGSKQRQAAYWACRASHLAVWSRAILDGVDNILIFEDDAGITEEFDANLQAFIAELPADYYGYQLGGYRWKGARKVTENCGLMLGCGALHAYGLSKAGLQRTYDHVQWHRTEDLDHATAMLHAEEPRYYCPRRWFVPQVPGYSDNFLNSTQLSGIGNTW